MVTGRPVCEACGQYEATIRAEFLKFRLATCHQCLVGVRAVLKEAFKDSERRRAREKQERKARRSGGETSRV